MFTLIITLLRTARAVFTAEFAAGIVHWFEDAYVREDTPLIGKYVARPNIVHHHYPRYMTRHNWWQSSWDLCVLSALVVLIAWACGVLNWEVWLFAILAANANEFHKWAHRTKKENGPVITFLQKIGLLQSAQHHALHHTDPKNSHYCTLTNYLNPVLDGIRFWDGVEWALAMSVCPARRPDTSERGVWAGAMGGLWNIGGEIQKCYDTGTLL